MDFKIERLSDQFFTRLPNVPRIPENSDFMKLVGKMRNQRHFEDKKGFEKEDALNQQDILKEKVDKVKKRIEELETKDKSLKMTIQNKIKEREQK